MGQRYEDFNGYMVKLPSIKCVHIFLTSSGPGNIFAGTLKDFTHYNIYFKHPLVDQ